MWARVVALLAVIGAGSAIAAVVLGSDAEEVPFDPAINNQVSARALARVEPGTRRGVVERRFGRGGTVRPDGVEAFDSERGCRYYTARGGPGYVAACYVGDTFMDSYRVVPVDPYAGFGWGD